MSFRKVFSLASILMLVGTSLASPSGTVAQQKPKPVPARRQPRNEALWQKALAIHKSAIVIDTHNDITTPMTNDDYDLGGTPPTPYRTSLARMKQGGMTAEFFSL